MKHLTRPTETGWCMTVREAIELARAAGIRMAPVGGNIENAILAGAFEIENEVQVGMSFNSKHQRWRVNRHLRWRRPEPKLEVERGFSAEDHAQALALFILIGGRHGQPASL